MMNNHNPDYPNDDFAVVSIHECHHQQSLKPMKLQFQ